MPHSIPITKPAPSPTRVLLVDDNAEGRRALARLLELYGYHVTAVADGASAFAELEKSPAPDVVLTDLMLPDMDGREVVTHARSAAPTAILVVITGWDFGQDAPERELQQADYIFLKPLNVGDLVQTLRASATSRSLHLASGSNAAVPDRDG